MIGLGKLPISNGWFLLFSYPLLCYGLPGQTLILGISSSQVGVTYFHFLNLYRTVPLRCLWHLFYFSFLQGTNREAPSFNGRMQPDYPLILFCFSEADLHWQKALKFPD